MEQDWPDESPPEDYGSADGFENPDQAIREHQRLRASHPREYGVFGRGMIRSRIWAEEIVLGLHGVRLEADLRKRTLPPEVRDLWRDVCESKKRLTKPIRRSKPSAR